MRTYRVRELASRVVRPYFTAHLPIVLGNLCCAATDNLNTRLNLKSSFEWFSTKVPSMSQGDQRGRPITAYMVRLASICGNETRENTIPPGRLAIIGLLGH